MLSRILRDNLCALLDAYLELAETHNHTREETNMVLLNIFTKADLADLGYGHLFEESDSSEAAPDSKAMCESKYGPCWKCQSGSCQWWDSNFFREKVAEAVKNVLRDSSAEDKGGFYVETLFANYDDMLDPTVIGNIIKAHGDPYENLEEYLSDAWSNSVAQAEKDWCEKIATELENLLSGETDDFLSLDIPEEVELMIQEELASLLEIKPPVDHYLKQEVLVNIALDTGDGLYDFTLNSRMYPCTGQEDMPNRIPERESITWLAQQQGYSYQVFWDYNNMGNSIESKFLESAHRELAHYHGYNAAQLVFLVKMTLRQLLDLNKAIRLKDRLGVNRDAMRNPYCGTIVLEKTCFAGLFDPYMESGGDFDIVFEKDVEIPIRYIHSALPDDCGDYSLRKSYDFVMSVWKDALKEIYLPKGIATIPDCCNVEGCVTYCSEPAESGSIHFQIDGSNYVLPATQFQFFPNEHSMDSFVSQFYPNDEAKQKLLLAVLTVSATTNPEKPISEVIRRLNDSIDRTENERSLCQCYLEHLQKEYGLTNNQLDALCFFDSDSVFKYSF